MRTVAKKTAPREIVPGFPPELEPEPCGACERPIVRCQDGRPSGTGLVSVGLANDYQAGRVALQRSLIVGDRPIAFDTNQATRFVWHRCAAQQSFTGQAPARKVRP